MSKITVLIADDHEILRFGISTYLASAGDITIVGEASTGDECLELFREKKPDVCVLDISMPGRNGIETAKAIREADQEAKILILSMHVNTGVLSDVLEAGIDGYLLKDTEKNDLLNGIRSVAKGQQVFSKPISNMMTKSFLKKDNLPPDDVNATLTKREKEVLQLIVEGLTSREIAEKLYISPRTVDTHRSNLMGKLEIKNTAELVRFALENNLAG